MNRVEGSDLKQDVNGVVLEGDIPLEKRLVFFSEFLLEFGEIRGLFAGIGVVEDHLVEGLESGSDFPFVVFWIQGKQEMVDYRFGLIIIEVGGLQLLSQVLEFVIVETERF